MHSIETYSLPGGLSQSSARTQWGYVLARGTYKTVTVDRCPYGRLGKGIGNDTGVARFTYQQRVIGTTGVRM
jgi:hypothetical protein